MSQLGLLTGPEGCDTIVHCHRVAGFTCLRYDFRGIGAGSLAGKARHLGSERPGDRLPPDLLFPQSLVCPP